MEQGVNVIQQKQKRTSDGLAVASLIIGIIALVGICCMGGLLGVVGAIFGIIAIADKACNRKSSAIIGTVLSLFALLLTIGMLVIGGSDDNKSSKEPTSTQSVGVNEESEITSVENNNYTIDFKDATSFESALNDGKDVNGKIVRFDVVEYKPDSKMGINCWSGEHLNFISDTRLNVKKGDIVVGIITQEPWKLFDSWIIPYKVIETYPGGKNEQETNEETTAEVKESETKEPETKEPETKEPETKEPETITKPSSEYEKAYIRKLSNYSLYMMFDEDAKKVTYFSTDTTFIMRGTYSGIFNSGVTISWDDGWDEKFIHLGGDKATLIDGNGFDWEYKVCDVEDAQEVLNNLR